MMAKPCFSMCVLMEIVVIFSCSTLLWTEVDSAQYNMLFLVSDDMRPEIGSYKGTDFPSPIHPKIITPNLDKLASKSLLLRRAYVQQAVCSPSRTSVLTGRRPDTTHVYDLYAYFREVGGNYTTLPQYFKENGYETVGVGKVFHPGMASGDNDPISWSQPYVKTSSYYDKYRTNSTWLAVDDQLVVKRPLIDMDIADKAVEHLQQLAKAHSTSGKPFFLAAGFHKPHLPFIIPKSYFDLYPESSISLPPNPYAPVNMPQIAWSDYDELRSYDDIGMKYGFGNINTTLPDKKVLELRRAYYAAISYTDHQIGRLLQAVEDFNLSRNTIISFWGDHGWQLGEHGEWCKHTNFELSTHAPMMIHIPGQTDQGIITEQLTEFVDLYPTLVEAAGLPKVPLCPQTNPTISGACTEGTSLMPLILGPSSKMEKQWKQAAFSQYPRMDVAGNYVMGYTMRTKKYRYTEWVKFRGYPHYQPLFDKIYKGPSIELYDHDLDPEENINQAFDKNYAAEVKKLSDMLHAGWRAQIPKV